MKNRLIILRDPEEVEREQRERLVNEVVSEVDSEGMDSYGKNICSIVSLTEKQARLIQSRLTPTFWASYSFELSDNVDARSFEPDKILFVYIDRRVA